MSLTTKQIIFFFLFLFSWLLLFLLGESYLSYVLLGGVSLFFLLFANELEWQKINNYKWLAVLWLLVFFGMGLSLFFSISLPLSLYYAVRFVFAFLTFWLFLLIKKSFVSSQQMVMLLLLIGLVILLISVSFQFFPNLANLLPGMNLLHATYGHNHLAALFLMIIPLSWWLASEYVRVGRSSWWWLLPLIFNFGLLFSFGRVAVVIGLIQFLFIYWQLKKSNFFKNNYLNFTLKILMGLFFIVLLGNIFFSAATLIKPDFTCPIPSLEKQLCKFITTESRPQYWRWAIEIVKNNHWLGSGPSTFSLAAKKYYLDPFSGSAHAHNAFLASLAEMGLVGGGLFIFLMLGLLYLAWKNLEKKKHLGWKMAMFLGVAAIYVDVGFDFDWEFIGIFSITTVLLALVIKDRKIKPVKNSFSRFFKIVYFMFALILILVAGLYLKTDGLIKANDTQQAFEFFPYFHWHRKIYENSSGLSDDNRQQFFKIYHAQPAVYPTLISETKDEWQRQQIKERWFKIDPWMVVSQDLTSYYLDQSDLDQAADWLQKERNLYAQSRNNGREINFKTKVNFGERSLVLAQTYLEHGDLDNALKLFEEILAVESDALLSWEKEELMAHLLVEMGNDFAAKNIGATVKAYELAKKNLPWILIDNEIWFEKYPQLELSPADLMQYLELTADWRGEAIGWKDRAQQKIALQYVEKLLLASDWQNFNRITQVLSWSEYEYYPRLELVRQISLKTDELVVQGNYELAFQLYQVMSLVLPGDYWLMLQLGELAILLEDFDHAQQLYQQCRVDFRLQSGEEDHYGCRIGTEGLVSLDRGKTDVSELVVQTKDRYFQVSQIIRGEAVWQDFEK